MEIYVKKIIFFLVRNHHFVKYITASNTATDDITN